MFYFYRLVNKFLFVKVLPLSSCNLVHTPRTDSGSTSDSSTGNNGIPTPSSSPSGGRSSEDPPVSRARSGDLPRDSVGSGRITVLPIFGVKSLGRPCLSDVTLRSGGFLSPFCLSLHTEISPIDGICRGRPFKNPRVLPNLHVGGGGRPRSPTHYSLHVSPPPTCQGWWNTFSLLFPRNDPP